MEQKCLGLCCISIHNSARVGSDVLEQYDVLHIVLFGLWLCIYFE